MLKFQMVILSENESMKIKITDLKTDRHWRSATGYDEKRFYKLLNFFKKSYEEIFGRNMTIRHKDTPIIPSLADEEELLFFTLFSLKSGLTYDLLGITCGMDASNARRNQEIGLRVLKKVLSEGNFAPKREFESVQEFEEYLKEYDTLIFDGTEQRIQRPKENQSDSYSGKKKHIR